MNPLYAHRFEFIRGKVSHDILMVFSATPYLNSEAFATLVEHEIEANLVPDQLLVVVREPSFASVFTGLQGGSLNEATLARLGGRTSVTLVGYGCRGEECSRSHVAGPAPAAVVAFADFRRRAITSIFNERHGFVEANATYHFENPSGRHTERFIRLSNILVRGAEIAFIGFCALPAIPATASIAYLDTPSLYALLAAINEQRSSFGIDTASILADNFSSYTGFETYPFDVSDRAVVLISASSSGSLAKRLVEEKGFEAGQIAHLLYLGRGASDTGIVCNLGRDPRENPEGIAHPPVVEAAAECPLCARSSPAIKLQGDQFEFAGPQQDALLIAQKDAPPGLAELMDRYAGEQVFELGSGRGVGRALRQFNINASRLLDSDPFRERLDYVLRRSLPASLAAVIAVDEDSRGLAELVAARVPGEVQVLLHEDIDQLDPGESDAIVIVALAIESGRTFMDVSRDLRSVAPRAPLLYLVGMSKTTGETKREALDRTLERTHNPFPYQFIAVERIVLPSSSAVNAWSSEMRLLIDPEVRGLVPAELTPAIDTRIARLRKVSQPMVEDLYLPNADRPLRLQPGFVFWPDGVPDRSAHTQSDVFFTIAAVMQRLRTNVRGPASRAILSNWFQQTVLAPANFGRFNDDCIQASLLRAAHPYELNYVDCPLESREMGRLVRRIVKACLAERGGAAAEFLLAIATGRLSLCRDDWQDIVEPETHDPPMIVFLKQVCKLVLGRA
jgi:hypothetical protein